MLEAVFGDAAVRTLAARAREDLSARTARLLAAEQERFDARLAEAVPDAGTAPALRTALAGLAVARRQDRA